jgi:hypothetical protein
MSDTPKLVTLEQHAEMMQSAHPVPEWALRICQEFGLSDSGLPKYRVIWNPDRTRVMNCMDLETLGRRQRTIHKYPRLGHRWIVEVLLPWSLYGPWHEEFFGPKPPDGEYCHTHTIQWNLKLMMDAPALGDHETEYMSLDDFGADALELLLTVIEKNKAVQAWQLRNYDQELIELEEKLFREQFDNVYEDNMPELEKLEKLQAKTGLLTSLDPVPKPIEKQRRARARKDGKNLIH